MVRRFQGHGRVRRTAVWAFAVLALSAGEARAGLTQEELARAGLSPAPGAGMPGDIVLREADGAERTLGALLAGKPALVLFADYTCTTLCGVMTGALADALREVPLREETDYRVLVIGFNPADGPAEAAAFRDARVGGTQFGADTHFLSGSPAALATLTRAVGFTAQYDPEHRQYAHPAAVLAVAPDGHLARVLDPLAVTPFDLRLTLADTGSIASAADHVALLCYGWDAVRGIYTLAIRRILAAACGLTALTIGGAVLLRLRRERREGRALAGRRAESGA